MAEISSLISCSSILKSSSLNCFQLVVVFMKQSPPLLVVGKLLQNHRRRTRGRDCGPACCNRDQCGCCSSCCFSRTGCYFHIKWRMGLNFFFLGENNVLLCSSLVCKSFVQHCSVSSVTTGLRSVSNVAPGTNRRPLAVTTFLSKSDWSTLNVTDSRSLDKYNLKDSPISKHFLGVLVQMDT